MVTRKTKAVYQMLTDGLQPVTGEWDVATGSVHWSMLNISIMNGRNGQSQIGDAYKRRGKVIFENLNHTKKNNGTSTVEHNSKFYGLAS